MPYSFVEDIVALGIIGATIEQPVFPGSQYKITTAARSFTVGHGRNLPGRKAFFVGIRSYNDLHIV